MPVDPKLIRGDKIVWRFITDRDTNKNITFICEKRHIYLHVLRVYRMFINMNLCGNKNHKKSFAKTDIVRNIGKFGNEYF